MIVINGIRGGQHHPHITDDGSYYDSIFNIEIDGVIKEAYNFCNTVFHKGYPGGILAEGNYGWLCILHPALGKCLYLFDLKYWDKVNRLDDCYEEFGTLPSLIPNPNHNGEYFVTQVLIHRGGWKSTNSIACQTIEPDYIVGFFDNFQEGSKGEYHLTRDPLWKLP